MRNKNKAYIKSKSAKRGVNPPQSQVPNQFVQINLKMFNNFLGDKPQQHENVNPSVKFVPTLDTLDEGYKASMEARKRE